MNEAIKISGLKKSYGTHVVLNGLDFCVRQGEIFALLGVNGAGKTTSLECIEGLRKYDNGNITIHGRIGIQLQSAANSHFPRPAGPHFPARQGHIKRPVLESGTGVQGREGLHPASL